MARMLVDGDDLVVRLSWWERAAARRGGVRVALAEVCRVTAETEWWRALRGVPRRGLWIPGGRSVGTRGHHGGTDFVALRAGRPVVCVELRPSAPFRFLAVSVPDMDEARATARSLGRAAPRIDTSTRYRQPVPVAEELPGGSARPSLPTGTGTERGVGKERDAGKRRGTGKDRGARKGWGVGRGRGVGRGEGTGPDRDTGRDRGAGRDEGTGPDRGARKGRGIRRGRGIGQDRATGQDRLAGKNRDTE
ncbi:hypothetical protein AB0950_10925, partial [Streptomyces sp. NPDC007189]|uniref:hypothetical protein n=1 Tax=Streptomyces sp. NPDC007189 TaxID=3154315 RepID=UPI003451ADD8